MCIRDRGSTDADVDADVDVDVDADAEASEEGGGGRIIRQFGDTFMAGTRIPRRWHVSFGGREGSSSSSSRAGQDGKWRALFFFSFRI